jgi:hypothetical protein
VRSTTFFTLFVAVLISVSCASNKKIDDMKGFINETVQLTEEFIMRITEAVNENDIVSTIESFNSGITLLEEKSRAIKKKYPDIDLLFDEPPAELTDVLNRLHIAEKKVKDILKSDKVRELRKDGRVQSAFTDLIHELEKIKFFQERP